jgi:hypothetical protein
MTGVIFINIPPGVCINDNFIAFLPFYGKPSTKDPLDYFLRHQIIMTNVTRKFYVGAVSEMKTTLGSFRTCALTCK